METISPGAVEWGVAGSASPGQSESGDHYVVSPFPDGILIAVVDGLGHGDDAAAAARRAVRVLQDTPQEPILAQVRRCHDELKATRGVVMSVAAFNIPYNQMTWMGVGNVQGILRHPGPQNFRSQEALLLRAGIVGIRLPALAAGVLPVYPGDLLIFATDGVRGDFAQGLLETNTPQQAAEDILSRFGRGDDDALVLVARFLGSRA